MSDDEMIETLEVIRDRLDALVRRVKKLERVVRDEVTFDLEDIDEDVDDS